MKFNSELNKESIKGEYYEKKIYLIPGLAILISILLFLFFILPQAIDFPTRINDLEVENQKLKKIKTSLNLVSNANSDELDSDIQTITKTLPQDKNFEKILNSISLAASLSNTLVISYKFQDSVSSMGAGVKDIPTLNFKIEIFGDPNDASLFIEELYKLNPISEVTKIKTESGLTTLEVSFYYKPFETLSQEQKIEINNTSSKQLSTLETVSLWSDIDTADIFNFVSESTTSATGRTSPF